MYPWQTGSPRVRSRSRFDQAPWMRSVRQPLDRKVENRNELQTSIKHARARIDVIGGIFPGWLPYGSKNSHCDENNASMINKRERYHGRPIIRKLTTSSGCRSKHSKEISLERTGTVVRRRSKGYSILLKLSGKKCTCHEQTPICTGHRIELERPNLPGCLSISSIQSQLPYIQYPAG